MPDSHVFISYARADGLRHAEQLEMTLGASGLRTWRDKRNLNPNQDFSAEIEKAIERASHVLVCLTPDVVERDNSYVRREILYAQGWQKPITPLVLPGFDKRRIPTLINHLTWLEVADVQNSLPDILQRLDTPADGASAPPPIDDPYRDYLNALYKQIVRYLEITVFNELLTLTGEDTPDAVQSTESGVLPMSFFEGLEETVSAETFADFHSAFAHHNGRLLLLGEPGAGKTTTLFAFARDSVTKRLSDPSAPLPILARISDWNAHEREPLADWLSRSIPALKNSIGAILSGGKALLLLDGLDELGRERPVDPQKPEGEKYDPRERFTQLFNPIPDPSPNSGKGEKQPTEVLARNQMVISCRVVDYNEVVVKADAKLPLNGAITLHPLNDAQMRAYLAGMPHLLAALDKDAELKEVARTPLILSLFTIAFRDAPEELQALADLSGGDLRDKIFLTFIERRYKHEARRSKDPLPFTLEEVMQYLGELAMIDARGYRHWLSPNNTNWRTTENVLLHYDFMHLSGDTAITFWNFCVRLHFLTTSGNINSDYPTFRFMHLKLRDTLAFTHSLFALRDADTNVRRHAAELLGNIGDARAVEPLIAVLRDDDSDVRHSTAYALGGIGDRRAVEALLAALHDDAEYVRGSAANALGEIGDARAVEPLLAALNDDATFVCLMAAYALAKIGEPAIEPLIAALLNENAIVRFGAAEALGRIGDVRALDPLITALRDDHSAVRSSAADALGNLEGERTVKPLIATLSDADGSVRLSAVKALGKIGDARTAKALIGMLSDEDQPGFVFDDMKGRICDIAAEALTRIGTPEAVAAVVAWRTREAGAGATNED